MVTKRTFKILYDLTIIKLTNYYQIQRCLVRLAYKTLLQEGLSEPGLYTNLDGLLAKVIFGTIKKDGFLAKVIFGTIKKD